MDNSSPDSDGVVQVFFLRDGKLIGREHFYMTHVAGRKKQDILSQFIRQQHTISKATEVGSIYIMMLLLR